MFKFHFKFLKIKIEHKNPPSGLKMGTRSWACEKPVVFVPRNMKHENKRQTANSKSIPKNWLTLDVMNGCICLWKKWRSGGHKNKTLTPDGRFRAKGDKIAPLETTNVWPEVQKPGPKPQKSEVEKLCNCTQQHKKAKIVRRNGLLHFKRCI